MTLGCLVFVCAFFFGLGVLTALFTKVMLVIDALLLVAAAAFVFVQLRAERMEDRQKALATKPATATPPSKKWAGNFAPSKVNGGKPPADGKPTSTNDPNNRC
jgi:hypothetical protein